MNVLNHHFHTEDRRRCLRELRRFLLGEPRQVRSFINNGRGAFVTWQDEAEKMIRREEAKAVRRFDNPLRSETVRAMRTNFALLKASTDPTKD